MPARCRCCAKRPNLSAVLVGNDQMALGVLSAFHQHQVAVPGEKSVIGYDDTYESSFFYPALSTVSLDLDLQGKEAVRRILASTSGAAHTSSILPARLVIRHSSGARVEQGKDLQAYRGATSRYRPPSGTLKPKARGTRLFVITPDMTMVDLCRGTAYLNCYVIT